MRYLRAFIAGMIVPGILLPLFFLAGWKTGISQDPHTHIMVFMPWVWGIWNVLYFGFLQDVLPGGHSLKLLLTGAILGFLVALFAVFVIHIPDVVGVSGDMRYAPLIIAPIVYALLWRYVVDPLNTMVGL